MFIMLLRATVHGTTAVLVKKGLYAGGCINLWCWVRLWISELTHTDLCLLNWRVCVCVWLCVCVCVCVCVCMEGKSIHNKLHSLLRSTATWSSLYRQQTVSSLEYRRVLTYTHTPTHTHRHTYTCTQTLQQWFQASTGRAPRAAYSQSHNTTRQ